MQIEICINRRLLDGVGIDIKPNKIKTNEKLATVVTNFALLSCSQDDAYIVTTLTIIEQNLFDCKFFRNPIFQRL